MKRSKIALAMTFSISALFLSACNDNGDDNKRADSDKTYLYESNYAKDSIDNASSIKVMTYNMTNVQGKTAEATAMVIFPKAIQPKDGYRVVVWEHGTVGVGDSCAPSNNLINPRFRILADSLLAAGYVIVAPDYEGLGTSGVHPYLNLSSEAKSALAAVKAVKDHYGTQLKGEWMSIGQSQGGHASLGTAEFANADVSYKGAVAGAPASSLGTIIQIYIDPQFNLDTNGQPKPVSKLDESLLQVRYAVANNLLTPAQGQAKIEEIADGYAELLAYAALASAGIKAEQPNYDLKTIFTSGAADIAELAYGRNGDDGACLSYSGEDAANDHIVLNELKVICGTSGPQEAAMTLTIGGKESSTTATGDGPVDATFNAVKALYQHNAHLQLYQVHAVTEGTDAQATVSVRIEENGKTTVGQAADTDTLVASANAYIAALNKMILKREKTAPMMEQQEEKMRGI